MSKNKIIIYCYSISLNGTLVTFNFQFHLGVPATPSGFPLYLFPLRSKRMPLQSLTLFGGGDGERGTGTDNRLLTADS